MSRCLVFNYACYEVFVLKSSCNKIYVHQWCAQVLKSGGYIQTGFVPSQLVIFSFYVQTMPTRILVDTMYICMYVCVVYSSQKLRRSFHSCWYCSTTGQWVCSGDYFIWVVVGADHCEHIPGSCIGSQESHVAQKYVIKTHSHVLADKKGM